MPVRTWPAELPPPERATWSLAPQEARRRRQADAGPPGYRRRVSAVARGVSLSLILTRDLKAVFDRFFALDCRRGADPFTMPDPTTDGWPLLAADGTPLLTGDGAPLLLSATWLCAWGDEPPTETLIGVEFRLAFGVWVLP